MSGTLLRSSTPTLSVSGSITPAGQLQRKANKSFTGQISLAGSIARSISKRIGGLISFAGSLITNFAGQFTAATVKSYDFEITQLAVSDTSSLAIADSPVFRMRVSDQLSVSVSLFDFEVA
jgi:hypothetical protein